MHGPTNLLFNPLIFQRETMEPLHMHLLKETSSLASMEKQGMSWSTAGVHSSPRSCKMNSATLSMSTVLAVQPTCTSRGTAGAVLPCSQQPVWRILDGVSVGQASQEHLSRQYSGPCPRAVRCQHYHSAAAFELCDLPCISPGA